MICIKRLFVDLSKRVGGLPFTWKSTYTRAGRPAHIVTESGTITSTGLYFPSGNYYEKVYSFKSMAYDSEYVTFIRMRRSVLGPTLIVNSVTGR